MLFYPSGARSQTKEMVSFIDLKHSFYGVESICRVLSITRCIVDGLMKFFNIDRVRTGKSYKIIILEDLSNQDKGLVNSSL